MRRSVLRPERRFGSSRLAAGAAAVAAGVLLLSAGAVGQEEKAGEAAEAKPRPPAKLISLPGVIDDAAIGRVQNAALRLQAEAEKAGREAVLVVEVVPGSSRFGAVRDLAQFLTSAEVSQVRVVAWVPESVDGNNVVAALAADEIVMHPDAELGDIGRGQPVDPADEQFVLALADKRHNPKVNAALARGMLDPQAVVLKAKVGAGADATARLVTADELKRLREGNDAAIDVETVKEAGQVGRFSGSKARALDVLVSGLAETRQDVATLYDLPADALRPDPTGGAAPKVAFIKVDGVIEPILQQFVERQIDRAIAGGANLIIFEIDSPGGLLISSQELASFIANLDAKKARTVAYVPEQALSGAAMISLGCDEIYLHPKATIGDAGPIETRDGQQFERAPEKVLSVLRKSLRDLAEMKGRPPAVCEAMADANLPVYRVTHAETGQVWYLTEGELQQDGDQWVKGPLIPESREDNLLTVGGARAHELKIAQPPVADLDELKQRLGIPADQTLRPVGRTWVDSLVFVLNQPIVGAALIGLGIVLIYLELHFMTGLLGILSALCFALFFWSKFLGGTAGWLEVTLFAVGIACLGLEVFVIPGFGVFGITGGLLILGALVMAGQTFGNAPGTDFNAMTESVGMLAGSIVVTVVAAMLMSRFLPAMPFFKGMVLAPPGADAVDGPLLRLDESAGPASLVGRRGRAATTLRPAGKAEIDGDYLDVFSEGVYIDAGAEIEVVRREGNRLIVREVG